MKKFFLKIKINFFQKYTALVKSTKPHIFTPYIFYLSGILLSVLFPIGYRHYT